MGAGLSGVGAACHLQRRCPGRSYAILEARDAIGGTWDLFRYPGVRSDSDMHTLGYSFRPWKRTKAIADGPSILSYIRETAEQYGVTEQDPLRPPRDGGRVVHAGRALDGDRRADRRREPVTLTASFLLFCSGYYRYDQGYTPDFAGRERFTGQVVHPQHWPEDLDYAGKRVVVIGSGATAITLVPAMAEAAAHVTMLQRSPASGLAAREDPWPAPASASSRHGRLSRRALEERGLMTLSYQLSRRWPRLAKKVIRRGSRPSSPTIWRSTPISSLATTPGISASVSALMVTSSRAARRHGHDHHRRDQELHRDRDRPSQRAEVEADIVVTATGLDCVALGGAEFAVDGRDIVLPAGSPKGHDDRGRPTRPSRSATPTPRGR